MRQFRSTLLGRALSSRATPSPRALPFSARPFGALALGALALGAVSVVTSGCLGPEDPFYPPTPGSVTTQPLRAAPSGLRRLTRSQYLASVRASFGDIVLPRPSDLEPDNPLEGLIAAGTTVTTISPLGVERYEAAAYDIAEQAMEPARRDRIVHCVPSGARDEACASSTLASLGRSLYRRELSEIELSEVTQLAAHAGQTLGDFYDGLEFGIALLLQSPSFLFREELGVPIDPAVPEQLRYAGHELASRMAYFLWNAPPDDDLLAAAASGALETEDGVREEASRMLLDGRAQEGVRAFVEDWLNLRELDRMVKDPTVFVHASPDVGPAAREETVRGFQNLVFFEEQDIREIMTTRVTFVNRRLAAIYDVRAPRDEFTRIELPADGPRVGLLGQIGVLAPNAHPTATSPTRRGAFVRERLLCEHVAAPPANVDTAIPEPSATARTLRERLIAHQEVEVCASCHVTLDGVGFGLEGFDSLGRVRSTENGAPIDTTGELDGAHYADARALAELVRRNPRFPQCMATQAYRVAVGRHETEGERGELRRIYTRFANGGFYFRDLMIEIVASRAFREATAPSTDEVMP